MKYELDKKDHISHFGKTLFRVVCVTSFSSIEVGEKGGYIESEINLSQVSGDAWVSGNAMVSGNAIVSGDARVSGNAMVSDNASIMWISKIGSCFGTLTIYKTEDGFLLTRGCFIGNFEEFKHEVSKKDIGCKYRKEYEALYPLIELIFGENK